MADNKITSSVPDRRATRRRTLKQATIAYGGRHLTIECVVRDLSATGARLVVEHAASVPDTFELLIELDGLEAQCEVIWRNRTTVGVRFEQAPRHVEPRRRQVVNSSQPAQRASLRRARKAD